MSRDESCVYYPQYCFHLSRTIDQWCPLRIVDIHNLHAEDAHKAQGIFFLSNHPIVWVRIAGVIVAVDYVPGRFVYTIDDSSGKCIECPLELPRRPRHGASDGGLSTNQPGSRQSADTIFSNFTAPPESEYDVGMVVIIKGSIRIFRDEKQLKIHKCQIVRSTDEEVQFWNKIRHFRQEYLSRPWKLGDEELRKCRKEYLKDQYRGARNRMEDGAKSSKSTQRVSARGRNKLLD